MPGPAGTRPGRRADLHAHTLCSDGELSPSDLIARARSRGLAAIAITDHDTVAGLEEGRSACGEDLVFVPGIEVSCSRSGLDLHLLGYFLNERHERLLARLLLFQSERVERARSILGRLESLGAPVEMTDVLARARGGVVGRPHIARALVSAGHAEHLDDAFRRFLGSRGSAFVPRPAFAPGEAIALIRDAGGVSVLAHPGAHLDEQIVRDLVSSGLQGIEVWHPVHSSTTARRWLALTRRMGLLATGGSDYHGGARAPDLGSQRVSERVVTALRLAASSRSGSHA
jgi:hypothetical protein